LAGLNANIENHRKRLKWVEDLSPTAAANIIKTVQKLEQKVAAL
jgi:hypothetical protein